MAYGTCAANAVDWDNIDIQDWADARAGELGGWTAIAIAILAIAVAILAWCLRHRKEDDFELLVTLLAAIAVPAGIGGAIVLANNLPGLCGWLASPEGMLMQTGRLGAWTEQTREWLKDSGAMAYAQAQIAQKVTIFAMAMSGVVAGIACLAWTRRELKAHRIAGAEGLGAMEDDVYCEHVSLTGMSVEIMLLLAGLACAAAILPGLCGWLASPEGMFAQTVLDKLQ